MSDPLARAGGPELGPERREALGTAAARQLATITKSSPQMQGITPRWLLRMLPWERIRGGVYRLNRRLVYEVGGGRVGFVATGTRIEPIPPSLRELPPLAGYADEAVLAALAGLFERQDVAAGEAIVREGDPAERVCLIAHGRADKLKAGEHGQTLRLDTLAEGDHVGADILLKPPERWPFTLRASAPCTVLALPRLAFEALLGRSESLRAQLERRAAELRRPRDKYGQAPIELAAGHHGEPVLPKTFVDYDPAPREYELSVAQTVLRIHTRVADLFNHPMDQVEEQLRLTVEALRETQESELLNNREFGLLHNVDMRQRVRARRGPPTPDDMDELLSRRKRTVFFLAHPRAIAAFGRECSRRGLYPGTVEVEGRRALAWRGVPILPSDKVPIGRDQTSAILAMRTGVDRQGVIGLAPVELPDEHRPGLSVRFMGIDEKAILSYLVSAYYSVAVMVPDALGVLEDVDVGRPL